MRAHSLRTAGIVLVAAVAPAAAQVPRDLADVRLEYRILLDDQSAPIGSSEIAFESVETKRGPRLRITQEKDYTLQLTTPFRVRQSVEVICDEGGVERFEAESTTGDVTRNHIGHRQQGAYHVTTTTVGVDRSEQERFPDDVRRANLGMFCAGFLEERMDADDMLREFPMLYPAEGTRYPRQKFRESMLPFHVSADRKVPAVISVLRKHNKIPIVDRYYHAKNGHQILLRLEEETDVGLFTWELTTVNGVPVAESDLVH